MKVKSKAGSSLSFASTQMTKIEIKSLLQEWKKVQKYAWSLSSDDSKKEDGAASIPSNFKKFTLFKSANSFATTHERKIRRVGKFL